MKRNSTLSNKKYILLLLGVFIAAIVLFFLLKGTIDLTELGKTVKSPTDTEDNLSYGKNTTHPPIIYLKGIKLSSKILVPN